MADVYAAKNTVIGNTVAVKILKPNSADRDAKARFLQEARLCATLEHPNIVRIYDFGEDEADRPFIVMEFLKGEDLGQALRCGRIGDLKRKLRIAIDTASAVAYIHDRDIIHRDIKPENIYITHTGTAKLVDFGISKMPGVSLTQVGFAVGSPPYMAPEQLRGETPTRSVDVYALGILLFELTTGSKPFAGDTYEECSMPC